MRADWINLMMAAARLPLRSDRANNQFERPWPYLVFDLIVCRWAQPYRPGSASALPSVSGCNRGFWPWLILGHQVALGQHPVMQRFDDRYRHFLAYSPTVFVAHVPGLAFNLVQAAIECSARSAKVYPSGPER
ncbi:hypothetical protein D3C77_170340 [compost metagenome]